jgi:invasion protein IalB
MKKFNSLGIFIAVFSLWTACAGAPAFAAKAAKTTEKKAPAAAEDNTVVDKGWSERCDGNKGKETKGKEADKSCEVFTRLEMKASAMRVTEVAIGFPKDLPKGTARGVIILPLGVMLEPGATMTVDEGKPFAFKSRFCTQSGCFAFVNLSNDIVDSMKKGTNLNIYFKTADNNDAHLRLALKGFDEIVKKVN